MDKAYNPLDEPMPAQKSVGDMHTPTTQPPALDPSGSGLDAPLRDGVMTSISPESGPQQGK